MGYSSTTVVAENAGGNERNSLCNTPYTVVRGTVNTQRRYGVLIRVQYTDNKYDYVPDSKLDELIGLGSVKQFHRADGWVTVGEAPVRGMGNIAAYSGPERRRAIRAA